MNEWDTVAEGTHEYTPVVCGELPRPSVYAVASLSGPALLRGDFVWAVAVGRATTPRQLDSDLDTAASLSPLAVVVVVADVGPDPGRKCRLVGQTVTRVRVGARQLLYGGDQFPISAGRSSLFAAVAGVVADLFPPPADPSNRDPGPADGVRPDPNCPPATAFPSADDVQRWHDDGGGAND